MQAKQLARDTDTVIYQYFQNKSLKLTSVKFLWNQTPFSYSKTSFSVAESTIPLQITHLRTRDSQEMIQTCNPGLLFVIISRYKPHCLLFTLLTPYQNCYC